MAEANVVEHNYFNNAHPNSLYAKATVEDRRRMKARQRELENDAIALERWARGGHLSAGLIDRARDLSSDDLYEAVL